MTVEKTPYTVGVLALQGAFIEHIHLLNRIRLGKGSTFELRTVAVRTEADLESCDALVLPGGESTAMASIAFRSGMLESLRAFCQDPSKPCFGTCAGMIMMASKAEGAKLGGQELFGGMSSTVLRNGYGGQLESFEASLQLTQSLFPDTHSVPFPGTFIRAPMLLTPSSGPLNASFQVLARLPYSPDPDNEMTGIVAWREGRKMAASFHPELSGEKGDERLHDFWVRQCCFGADADAE